MKSQEYINVDRITSIRFYPKREAEYEFKEYRPAKKFLWFTIIPERPSGWYYEDELYFPAKLEVGGEAPKGLELREDLFFYGIKIWKRARIDIRIDCDENFYEYFDSDVMANERISYFQRQSKSTIRLLKQHE